jgi:hypothetical protein
MVEHQDIRVIIFQDCCENRVFLESAVILEKARDDCADLCVGVEQLVEGLHVCLQDLEVGLP